MLLAIVLAAGAPDTEAYRREIAGWQKARDARLRADDGWLTLAGLFWLKVGVNRFGAAAGNDIMLPADSSPAQAGSFTFDGNQVTVDVRPGVQVTLLGRPDSKPGSKPDNTTGKPEIKTGKPENKTAKPDDKTGKPDNKTGKPVLRATLRSDAGGADPDVLALGALTMQVIERHGRRAIRLKDARSKTLRDFSGMRYYPTKPEYRIVARFVTYPKPVSITVPDVLGFPEAEPSPGYAEFELGGHTFRLHPIVESPADPRLFFIFKDRTAGLTTYGAGRFLYADAPANGQVVLDFNKAYTPPCAFTPYATCPLPPPENRLAVSIEAGELSDGHAHHP